MEIYHEFMVNFHEQFSSKIYPSAILLLATPCTQSGIFVSTRRPSQGAVKNEKYVTEKV